MFVSDLDDDACESSPCGNGATCHDLLNGYVCECAENNHGKNCELEVPQTSELSTGPPCPVYPHVTTDFPTSANVSKTISDNVTCPSCPTCAEVSTVVPEPTTHCPTSEADVDYCADGPCWHGGRLKAFYAFALTGLLVITGPLVCLYNSTKIFNFGLL